MTDPIKEQFRYHVENRGSTFNINGENMAGKPFLAVGVFPEFTVEVPMMTEDDLRLFWRDNAIVLHESQDGVGTWYDEANKVDVIDIVMLVPEHYLEIALSIGLNCKQREIFNLRTGESIPVQ